MKVFIWTATIFIGAIINTLIGAVTGIKFGAMLLFLLEFFIANRLCKAWDNRNTQEKNSPQKQHTYNSNFSPAFLASTNQEQTIVEDKSCNQEKSEPLSYNSFDIPLFCRKCGAKLYEDSIYCNKCGTKVRSENE